MNCSPSSRQLKKYKFFLPVEIYLLAVFMLLASKFHVFPLVLKFQDSFVSVYCYSNLYNLRSFLREYCISESFSIISFSLQIPQKPSIGPLSIHLATLRHALYYSSIYKFCMKCPVRILESPVTVKQRAAHQDF